MENEKRRMTWEEYLQTMLTDGQIVQLRMAMRDNNVIIVSGQQGPTGKSTLVQVLNELGYRAHEGFEVCKLGLNLPVTNMRPSMAVEIVSRPEQIKTWLKG